MHEYQIALTVVVFMLSVVFLIWRPGGINESVPPAVGAALLIVSGVVGFADLLGIAQVVSGAAITILSTIVMSIVLDSIGYFRWVANNLIAYAKGSGIRLYWLIVLLCYLMTLFFNNDGSILITTPIIIQIGTILNLRTHQKIPYLLSGALVATASSAPIGVSNLANLIALKIVGLSLADYAALMFVPAMLGISCISLLLFAYYRKDIPRRIKKVAMAKSVPPRIPRGYYNRSTVKRWIGRDQAAPAPYHPLMDDPSQEEQVDWWLFRISLGIVIATRAGFFLVERIGVPFEVCALLGAALLLALRSLRTGSGIGDVITKTPWHILLFAFSVYVLVVALDHVGMTRMLKETFGPYMQRGEGHAIVAAGLLLTVMSNLVNNLPSVMIGTLSLKEMGLESHTMQVAYLANIIGSDIGSLLIPMGTLASLIWVYLLRKNNIRFTWGQYMRASFLVIPVGLVVSLASLYLWTKWLS